MILKKMILLKLMKLLRLKDRFMKSKGIYDNWEKRRNQTRYSLRSIQEFNQSLVAEDIKRKENALRNGFDSKAFQRGFDWFEAGFSLDDAPENIRNNASFIAGFKRGKRIKLINQRLYDEGIKYYNDGVSLDEIPKNYRNNVYFMLGYNERKEKNR